MDKKNEDIDLLELAQKIWENKKFVIKCSIIGAIVGLVIAFSIPKEYTTTVILVPEVQTSSGGTMGSLAALAGISINSSDVDILASPDLYPNIFESTPFIFGMLNVNVKDLELNIDTTFYQYLNEHLEAPWWSYITAFPSTLIQAISPSSKIVLKDSAEVRKYILSEEDMGVVNIFNDRVSIYTDKKTGLTTIQVAMQSPEISTFIADTLTGYFQSYIIDYKTKKSKSDLHYTEKLYNDAKLRYYTAQQNLATFTDGNRNIGLAKYKLLGDRLQNEVTLAYTVYTQTAQQLEVAKVKVQDTTPVFTIIQPPLLPLKPSKPSKKLYFIGFIFLAITCSSLWVLRNDLKQILK